VNGLKPGLNRPDVGAFDGELADPARAAR
jgi:hypothetical protein